MDIDKLLSHRRAMSAVTSLDAWEFGQWLLSFGKEWVGSRRRSLTHRGTERMRALGGGRKGALRNIRHKLLFILCYFKLYPLQEVMGLFFGMDQLRANRWIHTLTPVLEKALGRRMELPARPPADLARVLSECPALEFVLDGVERPVRRPKDSDRQKRNYSGKKKRHGVKNPVVTSRGRVRGF